jgi:hypothetical protein
VAPRPPWQAKNRTVRFSKELFSMGTRGPQRRPEHLKLISGTARADRPADEPPVLPSETLAELPEAPDYLPNEDARKEWREAGQRLLDSGWLSALRLSALGMYCLLHGKILQASKAGAQPSAYLFAQYRGMQRDLGITGPTAAPKGPDDSGRKPSKWARLKQRADSAG